ncbi:hypothetical protein QJA15_23370, partial [Escherichia coli]
MPKISSVVSSCYHLFSEHQQLSNETTMTNPVSRRIVHKEYGISLKSVLNRPGFPGECFICELRLP